MLLYLIFISRQYSQGSRNLPIRTNLCDVFGISIIIIHIDRGVTLSAGYTRIYSRSNVRCTVHNGSHELILAYLFFTVSQQIIVRTLLEHRRIAWPTATCEAGTTSQLPVLARTPEVGNRLCSTAA